MVEQQPKLFENWCEYMKQRQTMLASVVFKKKTWEEWQAGHAKLYGILLWHYENKKQTTFKYNKTLQKTGYGRTHNYRLIKKIIEKGLLQREGNGHYTIPSQVIETIEEVLLLIKKLDKIGNQNQESPKR